VLTKAGNKLQYTSKKTGEIISEFRKNWTEDKLLLIMSEWDSSALPVTAPEPDETEEA
jgi:hypothetical protein